MKNFDFLKKMAPTILTKFNGSKIRSEPNNMILSAFSGEITEGRKVNINFLYDRPLTLRQN